MTTRCPYCAEEIQADAVKCKHCGSWLSGPPEGVEPAAPPGVLHRLTRSSTDRKIFGICGGLARYLNFDPTSVRVGVVVATIASGILPALLIYPILWFVIPRDDAETF